MEPPDTRFSPASRTASQRLRLAALRLAGRFLHSPPAPAPCAPRRLLVIRPDHLGDVLFTTPALAVLRRALPGVQISYLCGPWSAPLLTGNPSVDEVLTCEFPWFNRRARPSPWAPYAALAREASRLRGRGFDAALILRFDHWWGAWLAAQAGIPVRIGYNVAECLPFLTDAVQYTAGRHEVLQNLALAEQVLRSWGADAAFGDSPSLLGLHPSESDSALAGALAAEALAGSPPGTPLVAIHPGAGAPVKLWPAERWAVVGDHLTRSFGARILVTGSAAEADLAQSVARELKETVTVLAGRTSLMQLAALFRRCALVMGSDSGPLHLAVAAGAPTIHLFGPVDPAAFGPWGPTDRHLVLQPAFPESPCRGRPCDRLDYRPGELAGHPCMSLIPLRQVIAAAEGLLAPVLP